MKKTLLIATLLIFSAAGTANAQMPGPPGFGPPEAANPGARLVEELGLDEYQAGQIAAIFEQARVMHQEEHDKSFETHDAIRAETHAAVMALLNEEQQLRFEELLQLRAERWGNGPGHGQGNRGAQGGPGDGTCDGSGSGGSGNGSGGGNGPGNGPGDCTGPLNGGG